MYLILLIIIIILMWIKTISDRHRKLNIVSPPGRLIFKHMHLLESKTMLSRLLDVHKLYGGLLRLEFLYGQDAIIITDKDFIGVLLKSTKIMDKSDIYRHTRKWLGTGLLTSDRKKWEKHRRMISPAFRVQILEGYVETFHTAVDTLIERLKLETTSESVDILPLLKLCTLDIICETAMGTKIYAQKNECPEYVKSIEEECRILMARNQSVYKHFDLFYVFSKDYWKERKTLSILHDFTRSVLSKRKQENPSVKNVDKKRVSFLDLLLSDGQMPDEDIAQEVDTFMFAGHDTTASGISFALYCLSCYPDVQKKVYEELNIIFGNSKRLPTYNDLQQEMKYLEKVIKESLRLYPPVPFIGRQPDNAFNYNNSVIPKKAELIIFTYGLHRNPSYFPQPEEFIPERFESNIEPFTYIPFSAGIRNCIGQRFAMLEMKYLISRILMEFEVLPVPDYKPQLIPDIVLTSSNGIRMKLKLR